MATDGKIGEKKTPVSCETGVWCEHRGRSISNKILQAIFPKEAGVAEATIALLPNAGPNTSGINRNRFFLLTPVFALCTRTVRPALSLGTVHAKEQSRSTIHIITTLFRIVKRFLRNLRIKRFVEVNYLW